MTTTRKHGTGFTSFHCNATPLQVVQGIWWKTWRCSNTINAHWSGSSVQRRGVNRSRPHTLPPWKTKILVSQIWYTKSALTLTRVYLWYTSPSALSTPLDTEGCRGTLFNNRENTKTQRNSEDSVYGTAYLLSRHTQLSRPSHKQQHTPGDRAMFVCPRTQRTHMLPARTNENNFKIHALKRWHLKSPC
jgi:hypothetical protein